MFLYIADTQLLLLLSRILLYEEVNLSIDGLQFQYLVILNAALNTCVTYWVCVSTYFCCIDPQE